MNYFDKLPIEIKKEIVEYAFTCKKQQNFYINKEMCEIVKNHLSNCKATVCLGKYICENCDNAVLEWFFYMGCTVF